MPVQRVRCRRYPAIALAITALALLRLVPGGSVVTLKAQPPAVLASQNLALDPSGRIVDITLSAPHAVTAPWDRFRFDIDIVQPLGHDSGAILGDLTGDGVRDLTLTSWTGEIMFLPGIAGSPRHFGNGTYLRHTTTSISQNPFEIDSAQWFTGDVADLDGDGKNDIVIGNFLYRNVGTPPQVTLEQAYSFPGAKFLDDAAGSIGDLNADGKPDVVISRSYGGGSRIYWNNSTPGAFAFTEQILVSNWTNPARNRLAFGDLNGDGKLDLAAAGGIYLNSGTPQAHAFDFANASPWTITGAIASWEPESDQGTNVTLRDADGDGLLDAYVSNLGSTVWQVIFYKNVGTATAHSFSYVGPVTASSSPTNSYYRGEARPSISGHRAYVATADIDQNGLTDLLLSISGFDSSFGSTILSRVHNPSGSGAPVVAYQDLYTFPTLTRVNRDCGVSSPLDPRDPLCDGPNALNAWMDLTGDGLPDAVRADSFLSTAGSLFVRARAGSWPFTLGADSALRSAPSNNQISGHGVVQIDLNADGRIDMVTGAADGRLFFYRNTTASGASAFADPVPLTDAGGAAIDVGDESWPTAINLDGDGDLDFLVANEVGQIRKVLCLTAGAVNGYSLGPLLGSPEQDPIDVHAIVGSITTSSLATLDADADGLLDVIVGDVSGRVWVLRNVGTAAAPVFTRGPLTISRTAAAYLEVVDSLHLRLHFALPTTVGQTTLRYRDVPMAGSPISGAVLIDANQAPTVAITSPTAAATYTTSASSLNLAGTAGDDGTIAQVTWSNNRGGSGTASGTTAWSITGIALQSGVNVVTVTATDSAGLVGIDAITVTLTTTPTNQAPTVTITSPTAAATHTTSASSINLAGTASDDGTIAQVTWTNSRGGSGTASGTTSWSITGASLQTGTNAITVTATDTAGLTGTDAITITVVTPPTMTLSPSTLYFGAVNDPTVSLQTASQVLTLTQSGAGTVTWTAGANQPWINVSPVSGTGPATLTISILNPGSVLPPAGSLSGTVTVTAAGANSPAATINLRLLSPSQVTGPTGVFDTPVDGQQNVTGSIAVTGWAIDDIGPTRVDIYRDPMTGEGTSGGTGKVFIGSAVFVDGSRPDVAALFPQTPFKDRAGWGYMLLTNFLPNQGNGTFRLHAYASTNQVQYRLLGSKTITCTNATATAPFGAIDTPTQGGTASGSLINFGWALAGQPATSGRSIPTNGSTITVFIDSVPIGTLDSYNNPRPDIQALFPGYANTDGAIGVKTIDTTTMSNGVHTIAWVVFDNLGAGEGVGSRFFTVSNSNVAAAPNTSVVHAMPARVGELAALRGLRGSTAGILVRHGFDDAVVPEVLVPDPDGVYQVRTAPLGRIVLDLTPGAPDGVEYRGYSIDGGVLRALPIGSHFDASTGEFAWAPGLAFGGTHRLVFVVGAPGQEHQIRLDVRIDPK